MSDIKNIGSENILNNEALFENIGKNQDDKIDNFKGSKRTPSGNLFSTELRTNPLNIPPETEKPPALQDSETSVGSGVLTAMLFKFRSFLEGILRFIKPWLGIAYKEGELFGQRKALIDLIPADKNPPKYQGMISELLSEKSPGYKKIQRFNELKNLVGDDQKHRFVQTEDNGRQIYKIVASFGSYEAPIKILDRDFVNFTPNNDKILEELKAGIFKDGVELLIQAGKDLPRAKFNLSGVSIFSDMQEVSGKNENSIKNLKFDHIKSKLAGKGFGDEQIKAILILSNQSTHGSLLGHLRVGDVEQWPVASGDTDIGYNIFAYPVEKSHESTFNTEVEGKSEIEEKPQANALLSTYCHKELMLVDGKEELYEDGINRINKDLGIYKAVSSQIDIDIDINGVISIKNTSAYASTGL